MKKKVCNGRLEPLVNPAQNATGPGLVYQALPGSTLVREIYVLSIWPVWSDWTGHLDITNQFMNVELSFIWKQTAGTVETAERNKQTWQKCNLQNDIL